MEAKLSELSATISARAAELGLKFVFGPDNRPVVLSGGGLPTVFPTDGVDRATYLFAVAEA